MNKGENWRGVQPCFRDAPNVGAFYFEDAKEIVMQSGYAIGRICFTARPGGPDRLNVMPVGALPEDVPQQKFRVLRCTVNGYDGLGSPVCDFLLTQARGAPNQASGAPSQASGAPSQASGAPNTGVVPKGE